jgi:hypothetical protein
MRQAEGKAMSRRELKMPARQPFDGPCAVRRIGDVFHVEATQNGMTTRAEMSEYNAWRIFGCLALFLKIPLPPHVSRAIDLSDGKGAPPKATIGFPEPQTLGERLAQTLTMNEMERRGLVVREVPGTDVGAPERKKKAKAKQ